MILLSRRTFALSAAMISSPFIRPARARGARRLRLGLARALDTSHGAAAQAIAKGVADGTEGRYVVDIYSDSIIGDDATLAASIQASTIDIAIHPSAYLATYVPQLAVLDLPFLFSNAEQAHAALDGPEGQALAELASAGDNAKVLAWAENGFRHLTGHRPFRAASDLRDVRLRVLASPVLIQAFQALGARPAMMPLVEIYEALRLGEIDAQENSPQLIVTNKFYEVQSYLTLTAHTYTTLCLAISNDLAEDLSAADRAVFNSVAKIAAERSRTFAAQQEATLIEFLRQHGVAIISEYDRASYMDALEATQADAATHFGADRIARLRSGKA